MSPPRIITNPTTSTSPSSSSSSHLSPVTPKSSSEINAILPDESRPSLTNRNSTNLNQQVANLSVQMNQSMALDSLQQPLTNNKLSASAATNNAPSDTHAQPKQRSTASAVVNNKSPATINSNSSNSTNLPNNGADNATATNTSLSVNGVNSVENSPSTATRTNEDTRDGGVHSCVRPTEVQNQRTRRSARNLEESSRRRSSRNPRQSTSNAAAVNLVRNGAAYTRPSLDLPPGYGRWLTPVLHCM